MTNAKIEKVNLAIARTKEVIAENQKKLRDLERQKTDLENLEIIALFRSENLSQGEFSELTALLRSQREGYMQNEILHNTSAYEPVQDEYENVRPTRRKRQEEIYSDDE